MVELSEKRNYGIDLLRILAMVMVAILHVIIQGGALKGATVNSFYYRAGWYLEISALCAVNCYALISGYVGVRSRYKYTNLAMLWLRVAFYSLGITIFFAIFVPEVVGRSEWMRGLFPVMGEQYWYFTEYFLMFFLIPLYNTAAKNLSRAQLKAVVIMLLFLMTVLKIVFPVLHPSTFSKKIFGTPNGYDVLWLSVLYITGAYIGRYGLLKKTASIWLLAGYFVTSLCTWGAWCLLKLPQFTFFRNRDMDTRLLGYTSLPMFLEALFLLLFFERLRPSLTWKKLIAVFSPVAFSVYLIHTHKLPWEYIMKKRFAHYTSLPAPLYIPMILGTALAIFLVCSGLDMVREWIFQKLKIKQRLERLEHRWLGDLW